MFLVWRLGRAPGVRASLRMELNHPGKSRHQSRLFIVLKLLLPVSLCNCWRSFFLRNSSNVSVCFRLFQHVSAILEPFSVNLRVRQVIALHMQPSTLASPLAPPCRKMSPCAPFKLARKMEKPVKLKRSKKKASVYRFLMQELVCTGPHFADGFVGIHLRRLHHQQPAHNRA